MPEGNTSFNVEYMRDYTNDTDIPVVRLDEAEAREKQLLEEIQTWKDMAKQESERADTLDKNMREIQIMRHQEANRAAECLQRNLDFISRISELETILREVIEALPVSSFLHRGAVSILGRQPSVSTRTIQAQAIKEMRKARDGMCRIANDPVEMAQQIAQFELDYIEELERPDSEEERQEALLEKYKQAVTRFEKSMDWTSRMYLPEIRCECLVRSSYGLTTATFNPSSGRFQDRRTGNDETMVDMDDVEFEVYEYIVVEILEEDA